MWSLAIKGMFADRGKLLTSLLDVVLSIVLIDFQGSLLAPRMEKRVLPSNAPGEYKDVYPRDVMIDLDTRTAPALNLRMQADIQVVSTEVAR
jgi:hypothetical protein